MANDRLLIGGLRFNALGIDSMVFGGPFRVFKGANRVVPMCLLEAPVFSNIHTEMIHCPIKDFSVPDKQEVDDAILEAVACMLEGRDLYIGCGAGLGRTGLMMGCLFKVAYHLNCDTLYDPVRFIRTNYKAAAIETEYQEEFVNSYDPSEVSDLIVQLVAERAADVSAGVTKYRNAVRAREGWFRSALIKIAAALSKYTRPIH